MSYEKCGTLSINDAALWFKSILNHFNWLQVITFSFGAMLMRMASLTENSLTAEEVSFLQTLLKSLKGKNSSTFIDRYGGNLNSRLDGLKVPGSGIAHYTSHDLNYHVLPNHWSWPFYIIDNHWISGHTGSLGRCSYLKNFAYSPKNKRGYMNYVEKD